MDKMRKFRFLMPIGCIAIAALFTLAVMLLWNWLMPEIFGLTVITFWQALGLLVLCKILFGGFGGHGAWHRHNKRENILHEKWANMTLEDRKKFIEERRRMFGNCGRRGRRGQEKDENN